MHTSYKILTIKLTSSDNKNSTVYPGLLKVGFYYFLKKLFLLMQVGTTRCLRSIVLCSSTVASFENNFSVFLSVQFFIHRKKNYLINLQRRITVMESVVVLATICIVTLLLLANLAQTSHTETNIEPTASLRYASPKYVPVARAVASGIIPRVPMPRDQMEAVRRELDWRRQWVTRVCETIDTKRSHSDVTLMNMIVDT